MSKRITMMLECTSSFSDRFIEGEKYESWREADGFVWTLNSRGDRETLYQFKNRIDVGWFVKHFNIPDGWTIASIDEYLETGNRPIGDFTSAYDRAMSII